MWFWKGKLPETAARVKNLYEARGKYENCFVGYAVSNRFTENDERIAYLSKRKVPVLWISVADHGVRMNNIGLETRAMIQANCEWREVQNHRRKGSTQSAQKGRSRSQSSSSRLNTHGKRS